MILLHDIAVSGSAVSTVSQLGLGAIAGGLVSALISGLFATRRERDAARRVWLGEALSSFYSPVSTKLELMYQCNETLRVERAQRDPAIPVRQGSVEAKTERNLVQANVALLREVGKIVEDNLHYVDSSELRDAAITFLRDRNIDDLKRQANLADEMLADDHGIVMFPLGPSERPTFQQLVERDFGEKGTEFRSLSGGG